VARPTEPLIHKDTAIAAALEIVDNEGIDALSVRRLGKQLGVNGASLYHHFRNKEEIMRGVRQLVLADLRVADDVDPSTLDWHDWILDVCTRYRRNLMRHPNTMPLMLHMYPRQLGLNVYNFACQLLLDQHVPAHLVYPILDSMETLAFGGAMMKQPVRGAGKGFPRLGRAHPGLKEAVAADKTTADERFVLSARAVLAGWDAVIAEEVGTRRSTR
jgi:TetR/AcrR family tetracycline transcriptional repressor